MNSKRRGLEGGGGFLLAGLISFIFLPLYGIALHRVPVYCVRVLL